MSRHHNTKHPERSRKTPREFGKLAGIEGRSGLRERQERRVRATCTIGENHNGHDCNGVPFPTGSDLDAMAMESFIDAVPHTTVTRR